MGCDHFRELISRYVDEDLAEAEAEELLQHLPGCVGCRRELKSLEKMRAWFEAAEALAPTPEPTEEFNLAELLEEEEAADENDVRQAPPLPELGVSRPRGSEGRRRGSAWTEAIHRFFFLSPLGGLWRFAVPVLAVLALGIWWQHAGTNQGVDVRQLPASQMLNPYVLSQNDTADPDLDLYLLRHVAEQPLVQYGEEVPMVRQVSAISGR